MRLLRVHWLLALLIGLSTGLCAAAFNRILALGVYWTSALIDVFPFGRMVLPIVGAIGMSLLYHYYFKGDYPGFGIPQVLVELRFYAVQVIRPLGLLQRVLGSLVTLAFGLSAGRFGPIVHMGASVGSLVAYHLKYNEEDLRLAVGCGVVGSIATVFGMPLFAVVFTLEVMFRESVYRHLSPLLLTAVSATYVGRLMGITKPLLGSWQIADMDLAQFQLWAILLLLGILSGILGVIYILSLETAGTWFQKIHRRSIRLMISGLLVGAVAWIFPEIMVIHTGTFDALMLGTLPVGFVFAFIAMYLATTAMTLGSGFIGGNFFPGLVMGTALGTGLYRSVIAISPSSTNLLGVSGYAMGLLGAGGLLSAYLNAPVSSVVLIVEALGSAQFILPAMLVVGSGQMIVHTFLKRDIFSKTIERLSARYQQHG